MPRPEFSYRRRRGLVDWLVLIFIWITLAAGIIWFVREHVRIGRDEPGLQFERIWE